MISNEVLNLKALGVGLIISIIFFISGFLVLLTPLPIIYVSIIFGRKNGWILSVTALLLVILTYKFAVLSEGTQVDKIRFLVPLPGMGLTEFFSKASIKIFGASYFIYLAVIGVILSEAIRLNWGIIKASFRTVFASLFFLCVLIFILGFSDIVISIKGYFEFVVEQIIIIQKSAGVTNPQTQFLVSHTKQVAGFIFNILPSLVFVFSVLAVVVNILLIKRILRAKQVFKDNNWDLIGFKVPDFLIWVVIAGILSFLIGQYVLPSAFLKYTGINTLIAFSIIYFFQGLAIIGFFARKISMPFMRLLIFVFIILFFQFFGIFIVAFGIVDTWGNFRNRIAKQEVKTDKE